MLLKKKWKERKKKKSVREPKQGGELRVKGKATRTLGIIPLPILLFVSRLCRARLFLSGGRESRQVMICLLTQFTRRSLFPRISALLAYECPFDLGRFFQNMALESIFRACFLTEVKTTDADRRKSAVEASKWGSYSLTEPFRSL